MTRGDGPRQGPPLAALTGRLAACPTDFGLPVDIGPVLADVLEDLGHEPLPAHWHQQLAVRPPAEADPARAGWLRCVAVTTWLVAEPALGGLLTTAAILRLFDRDVRALAGHLRADALVQDPDRREELARLALRAAGAVPAGESAAQAADRLATLDTVNRAELVAAAAAAEAHARAVREAMARKRAEEAAARAMRE